VGGAVGCGALLAGAVGTTLGRTPLAGAVGEMVGCGVLVAGPGAAQPASISAIAKTASRTGRMPFLIVVVSIIAS
jgi:hypothetical protein